MQLVCPNFKKANVREQLVGIQTDKLGGFGLAELDTVLRRDRTMQDEGVEYERPLLLDVLPLVAKTYDAHKTVQSCIAVAKERDAKIVREHHAAMRKLRGAKMMQSPLLKLAGSFGRNKGGGGGGFGALAAPPPASKPGSLPPLQAASRQPPRAPVRREVDASAAIDDVEREPIILDDPPARRRVGAPRDDGRQPVQGGDQARRLPPSVSLPQISRGRSRSERVTDAQGVGDGGRSSKALQQEPQPPNARRKLKPSTSAPEPLPALQQRALKQHAARQQIGRRRANGADFTPGGHEYKFRRMYGVKAEEQSLA